MHRVTNTKISLQFILFHLLYLFNNICQESPGAWYCQVLSK